MTQELKRDDHILTRQEVENDFLFPTRRYLELAAVRGGGPPFLKIGRSVRYRRGDVRKWLEEHRIESTSAT